MGCGRAHAWAGGAKALESGKPTPAGRPGMDVRASAFNELSYSLEPWCSEGGKAWVGLQSADAGAEKRAGKLGRHERQWVGSGRTRTGNCCLLPATARLPPQWWALHPPGSARRRPAEAGEKKGEGSAVLELNWRLTWVVGRDGRG